MKKQLFALTLIALMVGLGFNPLNAQTSKGDTLVITMDDVTDTPVNSIIAGDTTAEGSRKHNVYELEPNGWYPLSTTLSANTYDLNIVGGKREAGERRPILLSTTEFGGWQMLNATQDLTLKELWIMQIDETPGGNIGPWYRAGIALGGEDQEVVIHDAIFDFNCAFNLFGAQDGLNLRVTNTLTRFSGATGNDWWNGFGYQINNCELDTVVFQNCTFYQGHFFLLTTVNTTQELLKFDHCTVVDYTHFPLHGRGYTNAEFTNNLFVDAFTDGEDAQSREGQDPDLLPYGIINADTTYYSSDTLISGGDTTITREWKPEMEAGRRMLVSNNNNFISADIQDYWNMAMNYQNQAGDSLYWDFQVADPSFYDGFMNSRTRAMFDDDATWPEFVLESTSSIDPNFTDYPDFDEEMIQHSKYYYGPDGTEPANIFVDPDGEPLNPTDPMVYDLSYTNSELLTASTTGGPIGDLTWFLDNGYNSVNVNAANNDLETAIEYTNESGKANDFELQDNYPNPFNPRTTISYKLNQSGQVKLTIYNLLGKKVRTLVSENMTPGTHSAIWNARDNAGNRVASGVYFYKLEQGSQSKMRKMLLMK